MTVQLFSNTLQTFLNATSVGNDRILRKEVSLGTIREMPLPLTHLGLGFAPFLEVATDDVIFHYIQGETDGLAPARAEDAESELAQKDEMVLSEGRASVIDWSLKDHYDASDVTRYREYLRVIQALQNNGEVFDPNLTVGSALEDFASKFARDSARRKRKLDNRINWLIMSSLSSGVLAYNDGKIKFSVDWGRPAAQSPGNAANDLAAASIVDGVADWSGTTFDPIGLIIEVQNYMWNTYMIRMDKVITTKKTLRRMIYSDKFAQRAGLGAAYTGAAGSATPSEPDPRYLVDGWGPDAAVRVVENATGVTFITDDSVYRTRPVGSKTVTSNRFWPEGRMVFLPNTDDLNEVDDTAIGFAKTLTSPHPEGNFTPGFYEWEKSTTDPWGQDAGTGIKAFPVFPHMDYTFGVDITGV